MPTNEELAERSEELAERSEALAEELKVFRTKIDTLLLADRGGQPGEGQQAPASPASAPAPTVPSPGRMPNLGTAFLARNTCSATTTTAVVPKFNGDGSHVNPMWHRQRSVWKERFDSIRMDSNENPRSYLVRIDEAVDMLACLEVHRSEKEVLDVIRRGLTSDYDVECCCMLLQPGICRADVESIIIRRHGDLELDKEAGGPDALLAGARSRGSRSRGARRARGRGTRQGNEGGQYQGQGGHNTGPGQGYGNGRRRGGRRGCWNNYYESQIALGPLEMYWPVVGPYPENLRQPQGSEPAIHPNDPRPRCTKCEQIGHPRRQCTALLTLGCAPNPPLYLTERLDGLDQTSGW